MPLQKISDGVWLDLQNIQSIIAYDADPSQVQKKPRVVLTFKNQNNLTWTYASIDEARELADRLASLVNDQQEPSRNQ